MNFYKMLDIIQSKNEGRIVLCDLGCFYITSGSNALLLNKLLKLKLICQEPGVCKVGFPKTSLEKYTNILKALEYVKRDALVSKGTLSKGTLLFDTTKN